MSQQQNQNLPPVYDDEIDLKELFLVLWKGKKVIIAVALIVAILTGLVTKFFIEPTYEAKLNIIASFPEVISTKYGDYTMPMTSNEQYINLIKNNDVLKATMAEIEGLEEDTKLDDFAKTIDIKKDEKTPNTFIVTVKSNSPSKAADIASKLYNNYEKFISKTLRNYCADYYISKLTTSLELNKDSLDRSEYMLKEYKNQLKNTPQTINQKDALEVVNINSVDYVVLENILNENYRKIELDVINTEQSVSSLKKTIEFTTRYLEELNEIKTASQAGESRVDSLSEIEHSVYLPSDPVAPDQKVSPSTVLNTVIGGVIGGMLSVIYVLIRKYWFDDKKYDVKL